MATWPLLTPKLMRRAGHCVAFPCEASAVQTAVCAFADVYGVKKAHFWRARRYCLLELNRRPIDLGKHFPSCQTTFARLLPASRMLPSAPYSAGRRNFKRVDVAELAGIEEVAQELGQYNRLSAQILALEHALRPTSSDALLRALFVRNLTCQLQAVLPDSHVRVFGSLETGMWTKNGDLDLSVTLGELSVSRAPVLFKLVRKPDKHSLRLLRQILCRADNSNVHLVPILKTRVPILLCIHNSGLKADISLSDAFSQASLSTSKLVQYLLSTSICPELRPLTLCLKWNLHHLKRFRLDQTISGFKLMVLVMVFLQEKRLLPPLRAVMEEAASQQRALSDRVLQPEGLGDLFVQLLAFLVDLCHEKDLECDLRSGERQHGQQRNILSCPEPYTASFDMLDLKEASSCQLGRKCGQLAAILEEHDFDLARLYRTLSAEQTTSAQL